MPDFLTNLLHSIRGARGDDMQLLCRQLLSQRGEASQTVLARRIITRYKVLTPEERLSFFQMLASEFGPNLAAIKQALSLGEGTATVERISALAAAAEPPRQELFRRINTGATGTETLVAMRRDLLRALPSHPELAVVDSDLKHLFRSWFNRGFLHLDRIGWHTSAFTLEKLIHYESVHEINGWPDLRRRLDADRRCFAFFQPALPGDPVIFVEVALVQGLSRDIAPLLDISAPVLPPEKADTAIFYSINNCLDGLRGIPFGNFLIKQVVDELHAELPNLRNYSTLSPVPLLARALGRQDDENGFTRERLARLLQESADDLVRAAEMSRATDKSDPVFALFKLLKDPAKHREVLDAPLRRLTLAYFTQLRSGERTYDPVAAFHLSNGARLEAIDPFANLRPYGLRDSFGVMVNYRYIPDDMEENHEQFVRTGNPRVAPGLLQEKRKIAAMWSGRTEKKKTEKRMTLKT
jgi:malonyl-CoA decarboxylase